MPRFCGSLPAKQRSIRPALNCATSPINSTHHLGWRRDTAQRADGRRFRWPQAFGAPRLPADRALAIERVAQAGADRFWIGLVWIGLVWIGLVLGSDQFWDRRIRTLEAIFSY